ncbi:MAG: DNA-binding response regulator, partial [Candidatus Puniceispirillaceae bacterium]
MTDKTLLILDDDAPLRGRLRRAMEVRGFEVMDAGTVQEGVEMVRKTPPAFAILDMMLQEFTVLTLVEEL